MSKPSLLALLDRRNRGSRSRPLDTAGFERIVDAFWKWTDDRMDAVDVDSSEVVRWAGRRKNLSYLGHGTMRAVFAVPEGALKVAWTRYGDGKESNLNEARIWEEAPERLRPFLVPVRAFDARGRWILMERVRVSGLGRLPAEARDLLDSCGVGDIRLVTNVADDGRLVDYGDLPEPEDWARKCAERTWSVRSPDGEVEGPLSLWEARTFLREDMDGLGEIVPWVPA